MNARTGFGWTPARIFMAVSAAFHVPVAIAGFLYDRTFPIGPNAAATAGHAHVFGIFETNGWHTLCALVTAPSRWACSTSPCSSRSCCGRPRRSG
jgi:hypothetical protein